MGEIGGCWVVPSDRCILQVLREQRKVEERKKYADEAAKWRDKSRSENKGKLTQPLSKKR